MAATSSGKISLALSASKPSKLSTNTKTNGVKRSHAALNDPDSEDEGQDHGRRQNVSHFDRAAGGAIDEARPKKKKEDEKVLVIQPLKNRDWREAAAAGRRGRAPRVGEGGADVGGGGSNGNVGGGEEERVVYGLNVMSNREEGGEVNGHVAAVAGTSSTFEETPQEPPNASRDPDAAPATDDDSRAIAALLGNNQDSASTSTLILPAPAPLTEDEAFTRDFRSAPSVPSLADYDRVPVEQFGAALLRGMGWKEGEGIGSERGKKVEATKIPVRRPALLGIGAKEEAAKGVEAGELGAWGRGAKGKGGGKGEVAYNPVLLRDKKTGELFTEEEAEMRKGKEEREGFEREFEREERRMEKEDRRRRERDGDGERKEKSDRKDRDRDRSRERRKRDSDEEYYRRKEKERRRKERDGSDYDRDRSKRHDSERERHRDRDRHREHRR